MRGTPALVLYRGVLNSRDRAALAFMTSTQLPLVLAITTVATDTGHMRPSTAAALVGAAALSTLVFPMSGLRLRGDLATAEEPPPPEPPAPEPPAPEPPATERAVAEGTA